GESRCALALDLDARTLGPVDPRCAALRIRAGGGAPERISTDRVPPARRARRGDRRERGAWTRLGSARARPPERPRGAPDLLGARTDRRLVAHAERRDRAHGHPDVRRE